MCLLVSVQWQAAPAADGAPAVRREPRRVLGSVLGTGKPRRRAGDGAEPSGALHAHAPPCRGMHSPISPPPRPRQSSCLPGCSQVHAVQLPAPLFVLVWSAANTCKLFAAAVQVRRWRCRRPPPQQWGLLRLTRQLRRVHPTLGARAPACVANDRLLVPLAVPQYLSMSLILMFGGIARGFALGWVRWGGGLALAAQGLLPCTRQLPAEEAMRLNQTPPHPSTPSSALQGRRHAP
jgi:hypothetical protein